MSPIPPPPLPGGMLNYRSGGGGIDDAAWQGMGRLCAMDNAILPARCVVCNGTGDVRMKRKQFTWAPPIAYLGLLGGLLPCIILIMILQKKSTLTFGICAEHRRKQLNRTFIALGIFGAAVACWVGAGFLENAWLVVLGIVVFLAMLIYLIIVGQVALKPKRIDRGIAEFKGCGGEFLASLPAGRPIV